MDEITQRNRNREHELNQLLKQLERSLDMNNLADTIQLKRLETQLSEVKTELKNIEDNAVQGL